jgi:hypothetical protein
MRIGERKQMRKLFVTAATAIAMTATPTIATAQQAAAAAPARTAEVQPSSEAVEGSELKRSGFILPLLLVVGIVLALLLLLDEEKEEIPTSP